MYQPNCHHLRYYCDPLPWESCSRMLLQKYFIMFFYMLSTTFECDFWSFGKLPLWFIYAEIMSRQLWTLCMFVDMYLQNLYYNHKATKQILYFIYAMLHYIFFLSIKNIYLHAVNITYFNMYLMLPIYSISIPYH